MKMVLDADPETNYAYINWNYMPPAGSSMIHPHLQVNCGRLPTNQHRRQIEACEKYHEKNGKNFWHDFVEKEIWNKDRYIGELGPTFWYMNYVPLSYLPDVSCLFPEKCSVTLLSENDLSFFLKGLSRILSYFDLENVYSFNMALFSMREHEHFRMNARITPRMLPRPIGNSDHTYFQAIHKEPYCVRIPESVTGKVSSLFFSGI
jgi:galactose-1-phosphate uridylyltransferase